jgi:predicted RecA/RadA family phage recombinase
MATNLYQEGGVIDWTNTSGGTVTSGSVVRIGHTIGIALVTILAGAVGAVDCTPGRVYRVPKVSAAVFVAGEKLLWDSSVAAFDDSAATAAANDLMGAVVAAAPGANAETTCLVMLTPGNATLTP